MSTQDNETKSRVLAQTLFPNEQWLKTESNIFVARGRLIEQQKEPDKWEKEMSQARILTRRGSVAFFLPEQSKRRCADLILDGVVTEMKTVSGNRSALGWEFQQGYKQGKALLQNCDTELEHSVFVRLLSDLSIDSVRAKIAGELKSRKDKGIFRCYFESISQLHSWSYDELRSIIGKK